VAQLHGGRYRSPAHEGLPVPDPVGESDEALVLHLDPCRREPRHEECVPVASPHHGRVHAQAQLRLHHLQSLHVPADPFQRSRSAERRGRRPVRCLPAIQIRLRIRRGHQGPRRVPDLHRIVLTQVPRELDADAERVIHGKKTALTMYLSQDGLPVLEHGAVPLRVDHHHLGQPPPVGVPGTSDLLARDQQKRVAVPVRVQRRLQRPVIRDGQEVDPVALVLRVVCDERGILQVADQPQQRGQRVLSVTVRGVHVQVAADPTLRPETQARVVKARSSGAFRDLHLAAPGDGRSDFRCCVTHAGLSGKVGPFCVTEDVLCLHVRHRRPVLHDISAPTTRGAAEQAGHASPEHNEAARMGRSRSPGHGHHPPFRSTDGLAPSSRSPHSAEVRV